MLRILLALCLALAPAQAGQMSLLGAGGVTAGGGSFTPTSTLSANYLNRVAVVTGIGNPTYGLSTHERNAVDILITGIVTDLGGSTSSSTWPILDALYILATTSTGVANLNLVSSSYTLVAHNSPTFAADQGYTGSGGTTAYLDTTFDPTALSGQNWSQNSATFGALSLNAISSDLKSMGGNSSGSLVVRIYPYFGGQYFQAVNQSTLNSITATGAKFFASSRNNSANMISYADSTNSGTQNWASVTPVGPTLVFLNDGSSASTSFQGTLSAGFIGGGMTTTQVGNIQSRLATYMASVP